MSNSKGMHGRFKPSGPSNIPTRFVDVLKCRLRFLQQQGSDLTHFQLQSAFDPTSSWHKGIYIFVNSVSTKMYVGSFYKSDTSSLFARATTHLGTANATCKYNSDYLLNDLPWRPKVDAQSPKALYLDWIMFGLKGWCMFPLQVFPPTTTNAEVLEKEQAWIDFYQTMAPHGFNACAAHAATAFKYTLKHPGSWGVSRIFGRRDMCRRTNVCYKNFILGRLTDANHLTYFQPFARKTIVKLYSFCQSGWCQNGVSVTDPNGDFQIPISFVHKLRDWLTSVLASLYKVPPKNKGNRSIVVFDYDSAIYDHLDLRAAWLHPSTQACLPQPLKAHFEQTGWPIVGFRYTDPLGLKFCNAARIAQNLSDAGLESIMSRPCICESNSVEAQWYKDNGFIPAGIGHIITCSDKVMKDTPDALHDLFRLGFKHRPARLQVIMNATVRNQVLANLRSGLSHLADKTAFIHKNKNQAHLWVDAVMSQVEQELASEKFADGKSFSNRDKPHEPGTAFIAWEDSFDEHISDLHRHCVVTTADKISKNYVVCCRKYYVSSVLADLDSGGFYEKVIGAPGLSPLESIADTLTSAVRRFASNVFPDDESTERTKARMMGVPYETALVKLHKDPLQLRFLACNGKNGLKPVAMCLTSLFRSLDTDIHAAWCTLLHSSSIAFDWATEPPWFCNRSAAVVDIIRCFNSANVCEAEFTAGGGWHGYDFKRLYTNISQDDIIASLSGLLTHLWGRHADRDRLLQVFQDKWLPPKWCDVGVIPLDFQLSLGVYDRNTRCGMKSDRLGFDDSGNEFYLFDLQEALNMIVLLVKFSFVRFGQTFYHQTKGIPMGINPAVYMANYYLFFKEFQFFQRGIAIINAGDPSSGGKLVAEMFFNSQQESDPPHWVSSLSENALYLPFLVHHILNKFRFTRRFVDDLISGPNRFLCFLLYSNQSVLGGVLHGIYTPGDLELERAHGNPRNFPTLDIRIVSSVETYPTALTLIKLVRSESLLYDKRRQACYDPIPIVRFTHVSSTVSASLNSSILYGQLHRFKSLIMNKQAFIEEAIFVMEQLRTAGYKHSFSLKHLNKFCRQFCFVWGETDHVSLFRQIKRGCLSPEEIVTMHATATAT